MSIVVLRGKVVAGLGQGAVFTQLSWVRSQFVERLGIDPYPGTLNLWLDEPAEFDKWRRLKAGPGVKIEPASPEFCEARAFPAVVAKGSIRRHPRGKDGVADPRSRLETGEGNHPSIPQSAIGIRAAIILPDVPGYPEAQVELMAAVSLRETLGLRDGDTLNVYVEATWSREGNPFQKFKLSVAYLLPQRFVLWYNC